ncbi:MAG: hypothetical protein E6J69_09120 [Deltaproteobacteria bacterium]|nr:MAG: hypothetical protein E6J69_09120 [Deltaproteobacteria bacterium]
MERAAVLATGPEIEPGFFRLLQAHPARPERRRRQQAARLLGVSERTLWYKLERYGLRARALQLSSGVAGKPAAPHCRASPRAMMVRRVPRRGAGWQGPCCASRQ